MQTFEFTPEEQEVLRDLLQNRIGEIDIEVFRTDTHEFKEMLKHRKETLEHVLEKLAAAPIAA